MTPFPSRSHILLTTVCENEGMRRAAALCGLAMLTVLSMLTVSGTSAQLLETPTPTATATQTATPTVTATATPNLVTYIELSGGYGALVMQVTAGEVAVISFLAALLVVSLLGLFIQMRRE